MCLQQRARGCARNSRRETWIYKSTQPTSGLLLLLLMMMMNGPKTLSRLNTRTHCARHKGESRVGLSTRVVLLLLNHPLSPLGCTHQHADVEHEQQSHTPVALQQQECAPNM